jgi:hypothetical protein
MLPSIPVQPAIGSLKQRLASTGGWTVVIYAALSAFMVYSSMYAFRKPFTAATFSDVTLWGASYKVLLVITQTFGYMGGKIYGIKFISSIQHHRRGQAILTLISIAWLSLLFFCCCACAIQFAIYVFQWFSLGHGMGFGIWFY